MPLLLEKYSRDVAFVLGIPPSYVVSKASLSSSTSSSQQCENSNTCSTNAQTVCRHLESLLSDVHEVPLATCIAPALQQCLTGLPRTSQVVYGEPAEFTIVPMPRVSIDSMDDVKNLMDSGLMLPEKAVQLVDILLRSQNLPESGEEGGQHARKVQKLLLEKPAAEGSSSSSSKKKKKKKSK